MYCKKIKAVNPELTIPLLFQENLQLALTRADFYKNVITSR